VVAYLLDIPSVNDSSEVKPGLSDTYTR